ncbi:MAG: alpha/beta fold hydrolase [Bacteroidota bacterium]
MRAPEYSFRDYLRWLNGANRGSGPMWEEVYATRTNYIEKIPSVGIPVFFLAGKNDYNTPLKLVEEYHRQLEVPMKELIVFEQSAHTPFLGEKESFSAALIRLKVKVETFREK